MFSSVNVCFDNSASWEGGSGLPKNHHTKSSIVPSAFSTPVVIWNTCVPASEPGKKISIPSYSIRVDLLFPRLGTSGFHLQVLEKCMKLQFPGNPCVSTIFLSPKLCVGRDWKITWFSGNLRFSTRSLILILKILWLRVLPSGETIFVWNRFLLICFMDPNERIVKKCVHFCLTHWRKNVSNCFTTSFFNSNFQF